MALARLEQPQPAIEQAILDDLAQRRGFPDFTHRGVRRRSRPRPARREHACGRPRAPAGGRGKAPIMPSSELICWSAIRQSRLAEASSASTAPSRIRSLVRMSRAWLHGAQAPRPAQEPSAFRPPLTQRCGVAPVCRGWRPMRRLWHGKRAPPARVSDLECVQWVSSSPSRNGNRTRPASSRWSG